MGLVSSVELGWGEAVWVDVVSAGAKGLDMAYAGVDAVGEVDGWV